MSTITPNALQSQRPPIIPKPFNANQPPTIRLYPLSNYTFGVKETQPEEDPSVMARLNRLDEHYANHGLRRTCEGILVCHEHNHPHILMLQIANAFFKLYVALRHAPQRSFKIWPNSIREMLTYGNADRPGDYLPHDADEIEGFKARLNDRLAPTN